MSKTALKHTNKTALNVNLRIKLVAFTTIILAGKLSGRTCPPG
jgi:hypothetical protein